MSWTTLTDQTIKPTDLLRFTYRTVGLIWIEAVELDLIESRLTAKGFTVKSEETAGNQIIIEAYYNPPQPTTDQPVQQASVVSAAIVIALVAAVVGGVLWLVMDKAEIWTEDVNTIVQTPAGQVLGVSGGVILAGLGILLLMNILRRRK